MKQRWLKTLEPKQRDVLRKAFNKVYDEVHYHVQTKLKTKMKLLEAIYIRYLSILCLCFIMVFTNAITIYDSFFLDNA